jgi:hypothetical protein
MTFAGAQMNNPSKFGHNGPTQQKAHIVSFGTLSGKGMYQPLIISTCLAFPLLDKP